MRYKKHNIPDEKIDKLMEKLDISLEEACETILADMDVISDETVEKLTKKAQKNRITTTIHSAKGDKKERKAREKKENPLKKQIISGIHDYFLDEIGHIFDKNTTISVRNDEKYIDLTINGREFTINLVEHRQKKG
jgi:predicted RNA-binding protein Jag